MGNKNGDKLFYGTRGNPQTSLEQEEFAINNNSRNQTKTIATENVKKNGEKKSKNNKIKFKGSKLSYVSSKEKIETYLLNINHVKGGSKAKFFIEILGYRQSDPKQFYRSIRSAIDGKTPVKINKTEFGLKYEFHEKIKGTNGKRIEANIVVIVQKDKGKTTFRIISVYPDKKEKK